MGLCCSAQAAELPPLSPSPALRQRQVTHSLGERRTRDGGERPERVSESDACTRLDALGPLKCSIWHDTEVPERRGTYVRGARGVESFTPYTALVILGLTPHSNACAY